MYSRLSFKGRPTGWRAGSGGEMEGERDVPCGEEVTYVCHVFVFHAEKVPHETTKDFAKGDEEGCCCTMLFLAWESDVEYP
jgi:hypothetical protein